jgi:hypothetical protein
LAPNIEPNIVPPPILPILFIITLLIYMLSRINTPNIATKETGKGNTNEIAKLMPKDIPIHPDGGQ